MESISAQYSSADQSVILSKQFKNPKRRNPRAAISRKPAGNFSPPLVSTLPQPHAPPSVFFSHPPSSASLFIPFYNHPQPPLLPLPNVHSSLHLPRVHSSLPPPLVNSLTRGTSCPPKSAGKTRDKYQTKKMAKQLAHPRPKLTRTGSTPVILHPVDLPKHVPKGLLLSSSSIATTGETTDFEKFPRSVFTLLSPPPSSLPLPKFSVRPKLRCNAEVAGVNEGATDDLRRLLRHR